MRKLFWTFPCFYSLLLFFGAWGMKFLEEKSPTSILRSYSESLWWVLNATSVGDASSSPETIPGRIFGGVLIFIGYALFSLVVGILSAYFSHFLKEQKRKEKI